MKRLFFLSEQNWVCNMRGAEAVLLTGITHYRGSRGEDAHALATALEKNSTVTSLDLLFNDIGNEGAASLAVALEKNSTVTSIDLSNNGIGAKGAGSLAAVLAKNSSLTSISLYWNGIGDEGAASLAAALERNSTVKRINLDSNGIGDNGIVELAAVLEKNSTVTSIDLRENVFADKGAASLAAALERNFALKVLKFTCPDYIQEQVDWLLARNMVRYHQWQSSVMGWMWASKYLCVHLPQDVVLMIGKEIWKTRAIYESPLIDGKAQASSLGSSGKKNPA